MLGDFPLDLNDHNWFVISQLLEYYQPHPLMFQQQQIIKEDNMELEHYNMSR